ncbi:succinate dehydrogenase iron-sulfur subunit [Acetonema longum]|uniref:succinate dehydrogenase n=1 Tax=Acetonema longum DSM 6540 TaxID=1009370 RepID=F7NKH8_9FIRM|nr:succinate dehydrogenase iron-sulfur subunit [Acetonema longum]EGO63430.1 succinate dehydrogenase iron-sulfur subunit [Acetonema longum DSM 6540]
MTSISKSEAKTVRLIIKRQDSPETAPYTQEFVVPYSDNMNVVTALMEIQKNPVTSDGKEVNPVAWDCNCLEEVCGACTMIINGKARQSCSALIDQLEQPIRLAPLTKFPVVRDLIVDRSRMFEALKKVKAWINVDGTWDLGPGPRMAQKNQEEVYPLSRCMTCGCCMEACPNFNDKSDFLGPAPISQVKLFNAHPTGNLQKDERLTALMGPGGLAACGNAQNCVAACPKSISLTKSIADLNRQVNRFALSKLFDQ